MTIQNIEKYILIEILKKSITCFTGQPRGGCDPIRVLRKGEMLMTSYEEIMVILTIGLLIISILNLKNK